MKPERVAIQIRRPNGDDPGAAEVAAYVVEDGDMVVLTDREGVPLERERRRRRPGEAPTPSRWERQLRPGEDAGRVARKLLMERYLAGKSGSDFYRPIRYPPISVA